MHFAKSFHTFSFSFCAVTRGRNDWVTCALNLVITFTVLYLHRKSTKTKLTEVWFVH